MLWIVWPILGWAGDGTGGFEGTTLSSRLLGRTIALAFHRPSPEVLARWRVDHPEDRLRLVLFLPGAYDGPADFRSSGLEAELRRLESSGTTAPALWVVVEHRKSWYADRKDGSFPFERFLVDELIPECERRHPGFGGAPSARTVAGLSMGGFGALNLAARTALFGRCAALSPALVEPPFDRVGWWLRRSLRRTFPLDPESFAPWNPWRHLGGPVEVALGCGTEDAYGLAGPTQALAEKRRALGLPTRLRLATGAHDWAYWRSAFAELSPWIAQPSGVESDRNSATAPAKQ